MRVTFPANFDRDDGVLTYDIQRNGVTIETLSAQSTYWDQPAVSYVDTAATPGQSYTYRVRARDPWGNSQLSNQYPITVASSGAATPYAEPGPQGCTRAVLAARRVGGGHAGPGRRRRADRQPSTR